MHHQQMRPSASSPKVLMKLGVGAFFGEQAILMKENQPYTVLAAGPVELLWVPGDIFQQTEGFGTKPVATNRNNGPSLCAPRSGTEERAYSV
eukprot:1524320-Pyramimonas_sp.AAC.1